MHVFLYAVLKVFQLINTFFSRNFNYLDNTWEVVNVKPHQGSTNLQVMEATVTSNLGKDLEGEEINFKKMKITNNSKICDLSGKISKNNVTNILIYCFNLKEHKNRYHYCLYKFFLKNLNL